MLKQATALSGKVAQDLLQRIVSGTYPPGSVLPSERELYETYGVSRTVVREAIKLLTARGIVSTSSGQAAVVASDLTDPATQAALLAFHRAQVCMEDLLHTRELLEPQIAALAAQHASPLQIRELNRLSRLFKLGTSDDNGTGSAAEYGDWGAADAKFHTTLAEASQNPVLAILIKVLVGILWHQRRTQPGQFAPWRDSAIEQHQAIAYAVAQRDPERARQAMVEHLATTRQHLATLEDGLYSVVEPML